MKLCVFAEFKNPNLLDKLKIDIPELIIDYPRVLIPKKFEEPTSKSTNHILETNAKLFYNMDENDMIDKVIDILISNGFVVEFRSIPFTYTKVVTTKTPISTIKETCLLCNSSIEKVVKTNDVVERIEYTTYSTDRIILRYVL